MKNSAEKQAGCGEEQDGDPLKKRAMAKTAHEGVSSLFCHIGFSRLDEQESSRGQFLITPYWFPLA
jgi:hypothetical protein